jgi:RNA polymerase sigma factor (sigma-70 family)
VRRRPETELVVLAREGSAEAAGALFDHYWVLTWRATYAVTADRGLADDAAQEALVEAFAALGRFDETQPFAPWLKRIAINAAVDSLRRSRRLRSSRTRRAPSTRRRSGNRPSTIRMGDGSEQILGERRAEAGYTPDPDAAETLAAAAAAVDGRVLEGGHVSEAAAAVRTALGTGPTTPRRIEGNRQALMPYVALLAMLPLGFVL